MFGAPTTVLQERGEQPDSCRNYLLSKLPVPLICIHSVLFDNSKSNSLSRRVYFMFLT